MARYFLRSALLALLSVSTAANSLPIGFYFGAQIGIADTHLSSISSDAVTQDIYTVVSYTRSDVNVNGIPIHFHAATLIPLALRFSSDVGNNYMLVILFGILNITSIALSLVIVQKIKQQVILYSLLAVSGPATVSGVPVPVSANFEAPPEKTLIKRLP